MTHLVLVMFLLLLIINLVASESFHSPSFCADFKVLDLIVIINRNNCHIFPNSLNVMSHNYNVKTCFKKHFNKSKTEISKLKPFALIQT